MTLTTRRMGDVHESYLAKVLRGRKTRGSGSTMRDQGDGKQAYREEEYVFCWDGKSTLGKSISITREMWQKIKEQSHWAIPLIPLRFYGDERLAKVVTDLVVVDLEIFAAMQEDANAYHRIRKNGCLTGGHYFPGQSDCTACGTSAYDLPNDDY